MPPESKCSSGRGELRSVATAVSHAVADQLDDGHALRVVVLDDQQAAHPPLGEGRDAVEGRGEVVAADGLLQVRDRADVQGALPLLLARNDVDGDVARRRVVLEAVEHRPAVAVGQLDVERDGVRLVAAGKGKRGVARRRHQSLEALLAREV